MLGRLTGEQRSPLGKAWADGKYHIQPLGAWHKRSRAAYKIEVVSRPVGEKGFVVHHRRWVVERTLDWLGRYRRRSRDYEWSDESSEAMLKVYSTHWMPKPSRPDRSTKPMPFKHRELQPNISGSPLNSTCAPFRSL
ncbi:MAG: hypothetical protein U0790_01365 [Isosphaeraceae bacterium]